MSKAGSVLRFMVWNFGDNDPVTPSRNNRRSRPTDPEEQQQ
jgi:hypothetical protein